MLLLLQEKNEEEKGRTLQVTARIWKNSKISQGRGKLWGRGGGSCQ